MRDDTTGEQTGEPAAVGGAEPGSREVRGRLEQRLGGRPLIVYVVLLAGGAALLLLLIIVWISAIDDDDDPPPCLNVSPNQAQDWIFGGQVERIDIYRDQERPGAGPSIVQIGLTDESCHKLPEGADNRALLLQVIGAADYYNAYADQQIDVRHREQAVPENLLVTSTPEPTVPPTARPASPTAVPPAPTATATPEPTSTPEPPATQTPAPPPTTAPLPATPTSTPASPQDQPAP